VDEKEWSETRLDRPLNDILMNPPVADWYVDYETRANPNCMACSFNPGFVEKAS
jgi:hypothetical protein